MSEATIKSRTRLDEISIRGLGVIENAIVEFTPGLNVITGETGAGKTMVITALSLVLGGKTDSDLIRKGSDRLATSARFTLPKELPNSLSRLIDDQELEIEESEILISRTVNLDGKSRAQLQGLPTTATALTNLASELIEIHGQHGTLQLSKPTKQRELLDAFGRAATEEALKNYQEVLSTYNELKNRLLELERAIKDRDQEIQELASLVSENGKLKPKPGELDQIDIEISRLESVEEIRQSVAGAAIALDGEEGGSISALNQVRRAISSAGRKDPKIEALIGRIDEAFYSLSDISSELSSYLDSLSADPIRLEELINRRVSLRNFAKRFGAGADLSTSLNNAMERAERAKEQILDLQGGEDRIASLRVQVGEHTKQVILASNSLSKAREQAANSLNSKVTTELQSLAMPKASFRCEVRPTAGNLSEKSQFGLFGNDEIQMLFSAHEGSDLLPIAKAASGGELSRLMLALEVVVAATSPKGTYLFDEVDAGIGGKAALEVGKRLKRLAEFAQIIVVTHLPQVAIWADNHLRVLKDSSGAITESSVTKVEAGEREIEIARMLSGLEDSEHAQEHARELLDLVKS